MSADYCSFCKSYCTGDLGPDAGDHAGVVLILDGDWLCICHNCMDRDDLFARQDGTPITPRQVVAEQKQREA